MSLNYNISHRPSLFITFCHFFVFSSDLYIKELLMQMFPLTRTTEKSLYHLLFLPFQYDSDQLMYDSLAHCLMVVLLKSVVFLLR